MSKYKFKQEEILHSGSGIVREYSVLKRNFWGSYKPIDMAKYHAIEAVSTEDDETLFAYFDTTSLMTSKDYDFVSKVYELLTLDRKCYKADGRTLCPCLIYDTNSNSYKHTWYCKSKPQSHPWGEVYFYGNKISLVDKLYRIFDK